MEIDVKSLALGLFLATILFIGLFLAYSYESSQYHLFKPDFYCVENYIGNDGKVGCHYYEVRYVRIDSWNKDGVK